MVTKTAKDFLNEANSEINKISSEEAKSKEDEILFIDVRDKHERDADIVIEDSVHLSRGMLEFYADKEGPYFNEALNTQKKIVIFCTLGARGALATKTLQDMGFNKVSHIDGGFASLKQSKFKLT